MAEGSGIGSSGVAMFGALMTVATIAVIVSNRANTSQVLGALGKGVGGVIGAAVSPVTGGGNNGPVRSPSQSN